MGLYLEITAGPAEGLKEALKDNLQIGRSSGEIQILDSKASNPHARIILEEKVWVLIDEKSKNGIRHKGELVQRLQLVADTEFQIGGSLFRIVEVAEAREHKIPVLPSEPPQVPNFESPPDLPEKQKGNAEVLPEIKEPPAVKPQAKARPPKTWSSLLMDWTLSIVDQVQDPKLSLLPFDPMLSLTFVKGLQAQTQWELGYGPRKVGPKSMDFPLYEPQAPDICFELLPQGSQVLFKTSHPDKVLLNGKSSASEILKDGDQIIVFNSVLEVGFIR